MGPISTYPSLTTELERPSACGLSYRPVSHNANVRTSGGPMMMSRFSSMMSTPLLSTQPMVTVEGKCNISRDSIVTFGSSIDVTIDVDLVRMLLNAPDLRNVISCTYSSHFNFRRWRSAHQLQFSGIQGRKRQGPSSQGWSRP